MLEQCAMAELFHSDGINQARHLSSGWGPGLDVVDKPGYQLRHYKCCNTTENLTVCLQINTMIALECLC